MAWNPPVVGTNIPPGDDATTRLELDHFIEKKEGFPVREDRLDLVPAEGDGGERLSHDGESTRRVEKSS